MTVTGEVFFVFSFDWQPLTPSPLGTLDGHRQWSVITATAVLLLQ